MPQKRLHSIVTVTVQDYAHHALAVVKENAKGAKEVVKMDVNPLAETVAVKDVKDVVTQCVKAIALLDVRLLATASVEDLA